MKWNITSFSGRYRFYTSEFSKFKMQWPGKNKLQYRKTEKNSGLYLSSMKCSEPTAILPKILHAKRFY